ncbi:MAG TPA: hypothetical protein VK604_23890 [Bryobacteraceae bacterium]|nr:hypothetical protein [Bryobacteraceae bacterium]
MDAWNGRAWKGWSLVEKSFWIMGFSSGYVWATIQGKKTWDAAMPSKSKEVKILYDALGKTDLVEGFTEIQLAQEVDRVYADDNNLSLSVGLAAAHAFHRLNKQYSEEELRDELAHFRALAIFSKTMEEQRK